VNVRGALIIVARAGLAIVGAVALYVLIYGGTGWLAHAIGYGSTIGHALGVINAALSPIAFGVVVVPLIAIALFGVLSRFAFKDGNAA
jgi:hypothetical protein